MKGLDKIFVLGLVIVALAGVAHSINYMYFSERERTVFGDWIKFWHGDTLDGPIRSNDTIAIMQDPVFYDYVISSAPCFWHGTGYNPGMNSAVILDAPLLDLPDSAAWVREQAAEQGHFFFAGETMQARVLFGDHNLRIWWTPDGSPFDTAAYTDHALADSAVVFFDARNVRISGVVHSILIFGASGRIGLEDDVRYASSEPRIGRVMPGHPEKLALISEGEIKILNTPSNGRENSGGLGNNQTNPALTDIVINGLLFALNESFTFENQNDPDSGYVCDCIPDDRGQIWLTGALAQKRRGYVHRSSNNSTGYLKQYRYDDDLRYWNAGLWNLRENIFEPSALDFGEAAVEETLFDTVRVFNDYVPPRLDSISIGTPFWTPMRSDTYRFEHAIPVQFFPTAPGEYSDTLRVYVPYYSTWLNIPVRGSATISATDDPFILHPSAFSLSSYPNPFNARATITFTLPRAGHATLTLFDVQGRRVKELLDDNFTAGTHRVNLDGGSLAAGVYLARLQSGTTQKTLKLLLLK